MGKKADLNAFHMEKIAQTAIKLFSENGVDATSMDDIAKAADYSKTTIYVYYKSKKHLHLTITLKAIQLLLDYVKDGAAVKGDAIIKSIAICTKFRYYSEKHPHYYNWIYQILSSDLDTREEDSLVKSIFDVGEEIYEVIGEVIQTGKQQQLFKEDLQVVATTLLYSSILFNAIELANVKAKYINESTHMNIDDFLAFTFNIIISAIVKPSIDLSVYSKEKGYYI
ncbi:MAG: TetR/AcrR family transcriptional regulator [Bacilli bacterium]